MKICIFIEDIDKTGGGPSRSVPILAKGLSRIGVDVTLLYQESEDMNFHLLEGTTVKSKILPRGVSSKQLEKVILSEKFDFIHIQMVWMPIYHKVAKICQKHKIKYATSTRGTLEPWCYNEDPNFFRRMKKMLAMMIYQRNDIEQAKFVLATADMEADSIKRNGIKTPIAVIPNGIEVDDYPCRSKTFANRKKQILFLSRIHPKKGIEYLIEAWKIVMKKYPDWSVVIVGNGEKSYISSLISKIELEGLTSCMQIFPPAFGDEKYKLYSESQLFVFPTYSENFGMVIAEAMSVGLPVITTKGTPWEILNQTKSGWWIDLSINNLTASLEDALSRPSEELFDMGQKASQVVRKNFEFMDVAERMMKAYEWALGLIDKPDFIR